MLYAYLMNIFPFEETSWYSTIPITQVTACKHNLPPLFVNERVHADIIDRHAVDTTSKLRPGEAISLETRYHSYVRGSLMERLWIDGGRY